MSNKLIKRSPDFNKGKEWVKEKLDKEGGVNVSITLVEEMKENNIELKDFDELLDILTILSDEGYPIYKISRVCKGEETRGMMICSPSTVVAFAKNPDEEKKKEND